jgi:methyl-accepting chemotaxis protein
MADSTINMLVATRSVIAKNQNLINMDPETGNYYFKGFVPALVGSEIANDFSLMTGYKLKQTSLKLRNLNNKPDEWEKKVLNRFELSKYPKGAGFGEILETDGKKIYRYMKPIYVDKACLKCHTSKDKTRPEIRKFLENKYPYDQAFGYKEGDVRGGISIIVPLGN